MIEGGRSSLQHENKSSSYNDQYFRGVSLENLDCKQPPGEFNVDLVTRH